MSSNKFFHLGIRKDENDREINIKLSWKSLGLILWVGFAFILLYEILSVVLILLLSLKRQRRGMERNDRDEELPTTTATSKPVTTTTTTMTAINLSKQRPVPFIVIVLLWGITTCYAIFYSFEVVFMYVNDHWHQLLTVQLLFTLSDVYVWCWMIGHVKYQCWSNSSSSSSSDNNNIKNGTLLLLLSAKSCLIIKFNHMLFNILVEQSTWSARNMMFFLEDVSCLAMAQPVFGVPLRSLSKSSWIVSAIFTIAIVTMMRFDGVRIT